MAVQFNGTDSRLGYGTSPLSSGQSAFTAAFMCIPDAVDYGTGAFFGERENVASGDVWILGLDPGATDRWRWLAFNSATNAIYSNSDASTSAWTSVIGTYDTTDYMYLYVNGAQQTDNKDVSADSTWGTFTSDGLKLGGYKHVASASDSWNKCKLAEVGFWNRALSPQEAALVAKTGCPLSVPNGLIFYAPLLNASDVNDIAGGLTGSNDTTAPTQTDHPSIIYPSHEIIKPPKKGKIWINDSPSWDSGAVLQKHPGNKPNVTFYWSGESTSFTANDYSAGDNTPTFVGGAAITTPGKIGSNSIQIYAETDVVTFDIDGIADARNEGSWGCWFKTPVGNWPITATQRIIELRAAGDSHIRVEVADRGDLDIGRLTMRVRDEGAGGTTLNTQGVLSDDTWYYVIARWSRSRLTVKLEVYNESGDIVAFSKAHPGNNAFPGSTDPAITLRVGSNFTGGTNDIYVDNIVFCDTPEGVQWWMNDVTSIQQLRGWTDTGISVGQVIDTTGLSGPPYYLGIENTQGEYVWHVVTIDDEFNIVSVSEDNIMFDTEVPWVITGIGMGVR